MEFEPCRSPGCTAIAVVLDRFVMESTDGPVEMVKTMCVVNHRFMCPAERRDP